MPAMILVKHAPCPGSGQLAFSFHAAVDSLLLGYEVVWLDVTRQTIAEKRLSTAAWKETLAVLTLGMAHDFTNIIAGIHSLSESFLARMDGRHPFHEGLSLVKKNSLQASQLVKRMVNLHLGQTGERNYHNLNDIVGDLVELVTKILPRRIQLAADLSLLQLPAYLDVVEFRQVVINLLLNAADAMPRGGRLTLRTSRHEELPALENMKGMAPRLPCICLAIEDTGCGIKPRHLASIFDPFFTTKAKGSGLGLYNARLAIEKLQGAISVVSKEGAGASFQIWLPEADFSESRAWKRPRRASAKPAATSSFSACPVKCSIKPPNSSAPTITKSSPRLRPTVWPSCFSPPTIISTAFCSSPNPTIRL